MPKISIITPCYNEEANVKEVYEEVKKVFEELPSYTYEHIFIDNASKDKTVEILKTLAQQDKNLKIIVNARNFGHIRSPFYALMQASGDAVIVLAADLQDPPSLIKDFIKKWEEGCRVVVAVKKKSRENFLMSLIRKFYYRLLNFLSETEQIPDFYGYGLYDRKIIEELKKIEDPYPYFRGLISELGYDIAKIEFIRPQRKRGKSKNNLYTLFDMALLGIVNNSKVPLRLAILIGFFSSFVSFIIGLIYLIYKLLFWERFQLGIAPLIIGMFFFYSVQLFFIGILGEYIGQIYTQVKKRPLVVEKERINF